MAEPIQRACYPPLMTLMFTLRRNSPNTTTSNIVSVFETDGSLFRLEHFPVATRRQETVVKNVTEKSGCQIIAPFAPPPSVLVNPAIAADGSRVCARLHCHLPQRRAAWATIFTRAPEEGGGFRRGRKLPVWESTSCLRASSATAGADTKFYPFLLVSRTAGRRFVFSEKCCRPKTPPKNALIVTGEGHQQHPGGVSAGRFCSNLTPS